MYIWYIENKLKTQTPSSARWMRTQSHLKRGFYLRSNRLGMKLQSNIEIIIADSRKEKSVRIIVYSTILTCVKKTLHFLSDHDLWGSNWVESADFQPVLVNHIINGKFLTTAVDNIDNEDWVGKSLLQIWKLRFGHKANLALKLSRTKDFCSDFEQKVW